MLKVHAACLLLATCVGACAHAQLAPDPVELPKGNLNLDEAVELALHNNPDVRISRQRVIQAARMVDESAARFWPEVEVGESFSRTNAPSRVFGSLLDQNEFAPGIDFNDPGTRSNWRPQASTYVTLYDGGRRKARLRQSESQLGSSVALEVETRSLIALEVARAWHQVHIAQSAARLSELAANTLEQRLEFAQAELEYGSILPTEVDALRLRALRAQLEAEAGRDTAQRSRTALRVLMGIGVQHRFDLGDRGLSDSVGPGSLEDRLEQARFGRPELVRAQCDIEDALAGVRGAEAGYLPQVSLLGSFGFNDPEGRFSHSNWLFGVNLVSSLTEALRTPHRIKLAMAELTVAHESGRRTLLEIEQEVEAAWLDARHAERDLQVSFADISRANESLSRIEAERESGAARLTQLLEAQLSAATASTRGRILELRRDMTRINLMHATGQYPAVSENQQ